MKIKKVRVDSMYIDELACVITGLDYEEIDANIDTIDAKLYDDFYIDAEILGDIVSRLIPLIDASKSPLTDKVYKGFALDGEWIVKTEV